MFHTSKTIITFSTMAITAVVLLFGSGPIVGNQKALAANLYGSGDVLKFEIYIDI